MANNFGFTENSFSFHNYKNAHGKKKPIYERILQLENYQGNIKEFYIPEPTEIQKQVNELYRAQKDAFKNRLQASPDALNSIKALNENGEYQKIDFSAENILKNIIKDINSASLWKYIEKGKSKIEGDAFLINRDQAKEIKEQWEKIIKLFSPKSDLKYANKEQWAMMSKQIEAGGKNIQNLLQYLGEINKALMNEDIVSISLKEVIESTGKMGKDPSVLSSIVQGSLNALQGLIFEEEFVKYLQEIMPETAVYRTGDIKVGSKDIKEDILALIEKEIILKNSKGEETYTFKNGQVFFKGKITNKISLTDEEYQQLSQASGLGLSLKTTNRAIDFHSGYNLDERYLQLNRDPQILQLIHFYKYPVEDTNKLKGWQRYVLAKDIDYIIGKNNLFLVSRNKIIPTYLYLDSLIDDARKQFHFNPYQISLDNYKKSKKVIGSSFI